MVPMRSKADIWCAQTTVRVILLAHVTRVSKNIELQHAVHCTLTGIQKLPDVANRQPLAFLLLATVGHAAVFVVHHDPRLGSASRHRLASRSPTQLDFCSGRSLPRGSVFKNT